MSNPGNVPQPDIPNWVPTPEHPNPPSVSWADLVSLYNTVNQMGISIASLNQASVTANGTMTNTAEAVAHLAGQIKEMNVNATANQEGPKGIPKFRKPKVFDGKATSVVSFLQEIKNAIQLSRRSLVSEEDKCLYFSTYLGPGAPKEWYRSVELSHKALLSDFNKFTEDFEKHFGDSNVVATAQRKLDELYQTGSAAQYIARFNEWAVHLDLSEASKIHMLYKHLKGPVKDAISLVSKSARPTKYKEYCDFVIEADDRHHEREVEKQNERGRARNSNASNHAGNHHSNNTTTTSSLPPGEPMEIDATKVSKPRGPLTKAERERRREQGLCLYCGGDSHKVKDCPNMSDSAKKAYAEKQKAATTSGKA